MLNFEFLQPHEYEQFVLISIILTKKLNNLAKFTTFLRKYFSGRSAADSFFIIQGPQAKTKTKDVPNFGHLLFSTPSEVRLQGQ